MVFNNKIFEQLYTTALSLQREHGLTLQKAMYRAVREAKLPERETLAYQAALQRKREDEEEANKERARQRSLQDARKNEEWHRRTLGRDFE